MSCIDDEPINNEQITPEHISSSSSHSDNQSQGMMGGQNRGDFLDSSMEAASVSLNVSLSVLDENVITQQSSVDFNEPVINTRQNLNNKPTVHTKMILPQAQSFESAIAIDGSRQFQSNDMAKKYFINMPHSLESTLPRYPSSDHDLGESIFLQPVVPHKSVQNAKKSKYKLESRVNSLLDIPVAVDKRRHSFSGNNEMDESILRMRQTIIGDEPKKVLRKQIAIDVEEPKLDAGKASVYDVTMADERHVLLRYNIDAYSFVKQHHQHETVIRTPTVVLPKPDVQPKYQGTDTYHSSGSDLDPVNVMSNKTNFSSHYKRSHYLEPTDSCHHNCCLSSGSDDSTGTGSSREPSPFRMETIQVVSPYSKERYTTCTPTSVIQIQDRKDTASYDRHSSSGSSDAIFGPTFPEYCTNIVITSETGESVKCETEDTNANEIPEIIHRRHVHPGNFKKHLHARYLESLRSRYSSSSTDTSQERVSQECNSQEHVSQEHTNREKSDSFSDVFDSTENDGMSMDVCRQPVFVIHYGNSETSDEPDLQIPSVIKSSLLPCSIDHRPLDLSQSSCEVFSNDPTQQYIEAHRSMSRGDGSPHAFSSRVHLGHHAHSDPDLLNPLSLHSGSPSVLQWSPHLQPQHIQSPQSPLCSVPEGDHIFEFNFPSPFEGAHAHSDPEFGSPSPNSPGLHFTFPPRTPMLSTASEVNHLAVSPRVYYPNQILQSVPKRMSFDDGRLSEKRRTASDSDAYICQVCGQVLPSYDNLARHVAKHLPTETVRICDNSKIHYCKVCNRSFSRSDMLTRHMRLHTGLKPYECSDCSQVFSRSDHLNTHKRTHTGEKPYRCPQCPYAACRRDMITRHMRTHAKRSVKRGKYLSVPERESHEVRKSSVSSTDTTSSQEMSRTFSASSADSLDLEVGNIVSPSKYRTQSASTDNIDMEIATRQPTLLTVTGSDSSVFDEKVHQNKGYDMLTHSMSFESPYENKQFISAHQFRQIQNLSSASFESFESCEDVSLHTNSLAHDTTKEFETSQMPKIVHASTLY